MRIGFDISQTGTLKAGCGYYAYGLIDHLTAIDTTNQYILYPAFGTQFWDRQHATSTYRTRRPNVRRGPEGMAHRDAVALWQSAGAARDRVLGFPDVVHANNYYCPGGLNARVVYTLYDLVALEHPEYITEANRLVCAGGLLDACVGADMLVSISAFTRARFLELFPSYPASRVRTVYPGSRFASAEPRAPLPPRLLPSRFWLTVGTLEPRKNLRRLVRAFARLVQRVPNVPALALVGGAGWLEDDFDALVDGLGLGDRIIQLGYVDDATLTTLYAQCFGFIYPSLVEGFGLPVLEAMSLGAPVITSDRSSLPEIVGDAGLMVNPEDEEALAMAMETLVIDAAMRASLANAGHQRAACFSWERASREILALYDEVLARPALSSERQASTEARASATQGYARMPAVPGS